jgi:hypothetical protein
MDFSSNDQAPVAKFVFITATPNIATPSDPYTNKDGSFKKDLYGTAWSYTPCSN